MNNSSFNDAYEILLKIYRDGAFVNAEMKSITSKRTAKLVYGVLDKHFELNYIVDALTEKAVKNSLKPLLLIGIYSVKYLDTPLNVVLNETSDFLKEKGKSGVKGFFSAVLNKVVKEEYEMPTRSDKRYLEVKYNMPSFLVGMFRKDYPDNFEDIINARESGLTHIRLNNGVNENIILEADRHAERSLTGYFVSNNREISLLNFEGKITYMSYASTLAAESVKRALNCEKKSVLDLCAAPGGKSVYLAQNGFEVISCDVYPHREELIKAYAKRMNVGLKTLVSDATVFKPEWENAFDAVLADVPCSGMGVIGRRKDIVFNKTYEDIKKLSELQKAILKNAARYVKSGGLLVYSTCTVFKMENDEVVNAFLESDDGFKLSKIPLPFDNNGAIQFLPDRNGMEGFYLCHMRKN